MNMQLINIYEVIQVQVKSTVKGNPKFWVTLIALLTRNIHYFFSQIICSPKILFSFFKFKYINYIEKYYFQKEIQIMLITIKIINTI